MLETICAEIKNFFTYDGDKHFGDFSIADGVVAPSFDIKTDYIRIVGSHKNDGVHKRNEETGLFGLVDEDKFHGAVWVMSPPQSFLDLVSEIESWQEKYGGVDSAAMSPFQSESFGGYSYSKGSVSGGSGASTVPTWQGVYASRLKQYRRIRIN